MGCKSCSSKKKVAGDITGKFSDDLKSGLSSAHTLFGKLVIFIIFIALLPIIYIVIPFYVFNILLVPNFDFSDSYQSMGKNFNRFFKKKEEKYALVNENGVAVAKHVDITEDPSTDSK